MVGERVAQRLLNVAGCARTQLPRVSLLILHTRPLKHLSQSQRLARVSLTKLLSAPPPAQAQAAKPCSNSVLLLNSGATTTATALARQSLPRWSPGDSARTAASSPGTRGSESRRTNRSRLGSSRTTRRRKGGARESRTSRPRPLPLEDQRSATVARRRTTRRAPALEAPTWTATCHLLCRPRACERRSPLLEAIRLFRRRAHPFPFLDYSSTPALRPLPTPLAVTSTTASLNPHDLPPDTSPPQTKLPPLDPLPFPRSSTLRTTQNPARAPASLVSNQVRLPLTRSLSVLTRASPDDNSSLPAAPALIPLAFASKGRHSLQHRKTHSGSFGPSGIHKRTTSASLRLNVRGSPSVGPGSAWGSEDLEELEEQGLRVHDFRETVLMRDLDALEDGAMTPTAGDPSSVRLSPVVVRRGSISHTLSRNNSASSSLSRSNSGTLGRSNSGNGGRSRHSRGMSRTSTSPLAMRQEALPPPAPVQAGKRTAMGIEPWELMRRLEDLERKGKGKELLVVDVRTLSAFLGETGRIKSSV